jgi:hypothetical protein
VYFINGHLTGVHLTGVYLMGVYLMGVDLIDVYRAPQTIKQEIAHVVSRSTILLRLNRAEYTGAEYLMTLVL